MKKYAFRLQAVLDYRTEQLNQAQQKAAVEEQKRFQMLQRIQEYDGLIEASFQEQQRSVHGQQLDLSQLQSFPNYVWRLKQLRAQCFQELQAQDKTLIAIREQLKQALIKKKSLEILKDKDYHQFRKQIEKAEEEFLADIAITRAVRQQYASR